MGCLDEAANCRLPWNQLERRVLRPFALRTVFPCSLVGRDPHDYYDLAALADGIGLLPAYPEREPRPVPALLAQQIVRPL